MDSTNSDLAPPKPAYQPSGRERSRSPTKNPATNASFDTRSSARTSSAAANSSYSTKDQSQPWDKSRHAAVPDFLRESQVPDSEVSATRGSTAPGSSTAGRFLRRLGSTWSLKNSEEQTPLKSEGTSPNKATESQPTGEGFGTTATCVYNGPQDKEVRKKPSRSCFG